MKIIGRLACLFRGHYYHPAYSYSYEQAANSPDGRHTRQRYQYTCAACGKLTRWMSKEQHRAFEVRQQPKWGGRDSPKES